MEINFDYGNERFEAWEPQKAMEYGVPETVVIGAVDAKIVKTAKAAIDAICDGVYTSSTSLAARYTEKRAEAERYKAAGYPDDTTGYPYLAAESAARGLTPRQQADAVLAATDAFNAFGVLAEAKRAQVASALAAATGANLAEKIAAKQASADALVAEVKAAAAAMA